jgi:hypothetical protein
LLRRTHLNVLGNVSRRMNVVMQSTLTSEVELDAPNTTGVSEESKNLPLVPKKKGGKLA